MALKNLLSNPRFIRFEHELHHWFSLLCICGMFVGLISSNVVMSIATLALLGNALVNTAVLQNFRRFFTDPVLLSISLVFFLYIVSGVYSDNQEYWMDRVVMKLPFLGLPFAFAALPRFSELVYRRLSLFFLLLICGSAMLVLGSYLAEYEKYTEEYFQGHIIPTPMNHIRYSLTVALAAGIGMHLLAQNLVKRFLSRAWVSGILLMVVFLIVFLHVLAVRSGLLALYLVLAYFLGWLIFRYRQYKLGGALLFLVLLGGFLAFQFIPTLHHRIGYARYDIEQFFAGEVNEGLSDAKRLGSIQTGIQVGKSALWTGVGIGDIRSEMHRVYLSRFPDLADSNPLPHNQFVTIFAGMGLLGLLVFLWSLTAPYTEPGALRDTYFMAFQLVLLPSFFTENTVGTQLGIALYLTFLLLAIKQLRDAATQQPPPDEVSEGSEGLEKAASTP